MNESFYISLPSNSNSGNTQSSFTTYLSEEINLKVPFEVALSDITFSNNFYVDLGSMIIRNPLSGIKNASDWFTINYEVKNGLTLENFASELDQITRNQLVFQALYPFCKKQDSEWLVGERSSVYYSYELCQNKNFFQSVQWKETLANLLNDNKSKEIFEKIPTFTSKDNRMILETNGGYIKNVSGLLDVIFFKDAIVGSNNQVRNKLEISLPPKINIINYILIYTDIIEQQFYGNKKTQILKSLPLKNTTNNIAETTFDNQHYVTVKNTRINTINIELRDIFGQQIKFDDFFSFVIVNLHFRPKKNGLE